MKSLRRKISISMRRSRSSFVDESISELAENEAKDDSGVVNESLSCGYGNDGRTTELDDVTASVVMRNSHIRKRPTKRLSLPAHLQPPPSFFQRNPSPGEAPMSRRLRRASMSEFGFGKLESYIKLNKLGEGTYAKVFKGKSKLTNDLVALKEIRLEHEEGAPCTAIREASLLKDLKQANIVTLHDIIHTEQNLVLVFEYLDRDLKQYMNLHDNILSLNNVKLLRGIAYCHRKNILHRDRFPFRSVTHLHCSDLKPQNLLINDRGELKLADFGLARAKSVPTKTYSNEVVTLWYRPPDVLLGSTEYNSSIDIWGIGCIFYEMVTGQPLFPGSTVTDQLALIFKTLGTPTEETWKGVSRLPSYKSQSGRIHPGESMRSIAPRLEHDGIDMISKFLEYNPSKRMGANDGQHHYFFNCFGPNIHKLPDTASIFTLPDIKLTKNPGNRLYQKGRRQSMLF